MFSTEIEEYLIDCRIRGLSDVTIYNRKYQLPKIARYLKREFDIESFTQVDLMMLKKYVAYEIERGMGHRTTNTRIKVIRAFLDYLQNEGYMKENPARKLKFIKEEKSLFEVFNDGEIKKMMDFYDNKSYLSSQRKTVIFLLADTGMRIDELINIQMSDVNGKMVKVTGKGKKQRFVVIGYKCQKQILIYSKLRLRQLAEKCSQSEYLFVSRKNYDKYESNGALQAMIVKLGKEVGVRKQVRCSPHTFRHYYAIKSLMLGVPIEQISKNLGHETLGTTQIYLKKITNDQLIQKSMKYSKSPLDILK